MIWAVVLTWILFMVSSKNYVVSSLAGAANLLVTLTVLASVKVSGWSLGIAESVGIVIFTGVSIYHNAHMCHQYAASIHNKRRKRVDAGFTNVGTPLTYGAITSFLTGLFLTQCQFSYLHKFGIMMMFTVSAALCSALIFLPAISYFMGPQYQEGDIMKRVVVPIKQRVQTRRRLNRTGRLSQCWRRRREEIGSSNHDSDDPELDPS